MSLQNITEEKVVDFIENFSFYDNLSEKKRETKISFKSIEIETIEQNLSRYINEFWTAKQRQACSLHETPYRACFKPQLPRFFINLLSKNNNDIIYDPFSGRGTTPIEAALLGRNFISNDVSPLSEILTYPKLHIPNLKELNSRLNHIPMSKNQKAYIDLSMFYHPGTEAQIVSLRNYLISRKAEKKEDDLDKWIRMVATTRLTGHSKGYFSVYTLPPNQAVSQKSQIKINKKRNQKPEYRDINKIILKKSKSLIRDILDEQKINLSHINSLFLQKDARFTPKIKNNSVSLTVTSPPFLDIVQYSKDNWLRCWFNNINADEIGNKITVLKSIDDWTFVMGDVFKELFRVTKHNGWVAFEVGEVRKGKIRLDEYVIPLGIKAGFNCLGVMINLQDFTKTANLWGISNNGQGTNTNRIVIFHKR